MSGERVGKKVYASDGEGGTDRGILRVRWCGGVGNEGIAMSPELKDAKVKCLVREQWRDFVKPRMAV